MHGIKRYGLLLMRFPHSQGTTLLQIFHFQKMEISVNSEFLPSPEKEMFTQLLTLRQEDSCPDSPARRVNNAPHPAYRGQGAFSFGNGVGYSLTSYGVWLKSYA